MALRDSWAKGKRWLNIFMNQFRLLFEKNRRPDGDAEGVVVIKMDAIGDFLIWLDSASQYPLMYRGKSLTLVCNAVCEDIAGQAGYFHTVIGIDSKRFEADNRYKKEILKDFETKRYEILVQTAYSRTIDMDLLAYRIPAVVKIGFEADDSRLNLSRYIASKAVRKKADRAYDRLVPVSDGCTMEAKRNAEFINGLGWGFEAGYSSLPEQEVREGLIPKEPYFVLFPGASSKKKMWPIENYAEVTCYVVRNKNLDAYVCGSRAEAFLYDSLLRNISDERVRSRIHNYCGQTSLPELAEVIRHAMFLIGNDTSGIHFAAAVNTKGICLFGEFSYGRFLPYDVDRGKDSHNEIRVCSMDMECKGCASGKMTAECKRHLARTGVYLCVDKISVGQVIDAVENLQI